MAESSGEIVHVDRKVEVVARPVKISIGVDVPKEDSWFWVEFDCWGQGCGTVFLDLQEAIRWCISCYNKNLNRPMRITDRTGAVVYSPDWSRYDD